MVSYTIPNETEDLLKINSDRMKKYRLFLILIFLFFSITSCEKSTNTFSAWYEFKPNEHGASERMNMSDWLDETAGEHGYLRMDNGDFVFADGTPVKFWGVNINSSKPYSEKEDVDRWVPFLSKYGINSVRFHKYTQHGLTDENSTVIAPDKMARFDYFQYQLREAGIYYGWSPIYGHKLRPGDKERLLAYDEIVNADMNSHLSGSTIGLVNFAEDLQQLHIELIVNKLNHKNPYTGLRYADDPALIFVEFQNEDNIFFATTDKMLQLCPAYKQLLVDKFSKWLRNQYADQKGLEKAWGTDAFEWGREVRKEDWNLDKGNICPVAGHGIYDYEYKMALKRDEPLPKFLLDMARFLYEEQLKFYRKFEKAVRETGYKGPLVGSCWQAGSGISHFYNLHADYLTGIVDRHNYFGGGTGHRLISGDFNNKSMLAQPGSGILGTGLQQVDDRPFALSEWMSLIPNEWVAEGPVLVATYGLGLQGWDASYAFAVDFEHFTSTLHTPGVYNVTSPTQLVLYPALVSTVYNQDIKEAEVISRRNVHIPSLKQGKLGFKDYQVQDWDQKEFGGDLPQEVLAKGRAVVDFTDEYEPTYHPDLTKDISSGTIRSQTGQLVWNYDGVEKGNIHINTPSLQGVTGFSDGKSVTLDDIKVKTHNPFAVVLVSSLEKGRSLEESKRWLITTIARAKNTNMVYNKEKDRILETGEAPILLEAVDFSVTFRNKTPKSLRILDHAGYDTGESIDITRNKITIKGNHHKTFYYEVEF